MISRFKKEIVNLLTLFNEYWSNSELIKCLKQKGTNKNSSKKKQIKLDFYYKDHVMIDDKDEKKYYNEYSEKEKINEVLKKYSMKNIKKYYNDKIVYNNKITDKDNLIIKGDNFVALNILKDIYREKVKLIYIDPPYNTKNKDIQYNDEFDHATWLVFMKNRLELAKEMLNQKGSVWINISDEELHYLKILCDEIFGRSNFIANIIWQKKVNSRSKKEYFSDLHEHILVYSKNRKKFQLLNNEEKDSFDIKTLWTKNNMSDKEDAKKELENILGGKLFSTPKPEELLRRIIQLGTKEGDLVLDFFMGSATTQAVALKLHRQFIGIEKMEYINSVSIPRLMKVMKGEQGGISKKVNWKGGGSFIYAEVSKDNY